MVRLKEVCSSQLSSIVIPKCSSEEEDWFNYRAFVLQVLSKKEAEFSPRGPPPLLSSSNNFASPLKEVKQQRIQELNIFKHNAE